MKIKPIRKKCGASLPAIYKEGGLYILNSKFAQIKK
jgi:hypothetical protein